MTIDSIPLHKSNLLLIYYQIYEYFWLGFANQFHRQLTVTESTFKKYKMLGCATII